MTTVTGLTGGPATQRPATGLHELFEAQAARTPEATAVIAGATALGYAELDGRANRLAHHLLRHGMGLESRVAVRMRRSPALVVAMLGILKAGAVYVPVDPAYPAERLALILRDPGVEMLITDTPVADDLVPAHVRVLGDAPDALRDEPATKPPVRPVGGNLAYVFYTSGSTGRPKGVMVPHEAICNHTLWFQQRFQLDTTDRLLHKTPIGFDPSVTEFMAPLVAGGQLVLAADYAHRDPAHLVATVIEQEITVLQVVPTLLRLLLEQRRLPECRSLRLLVSGGEALPRDLVTRVRALLPVEIHNLYGPTEAAIDVTCLDTGLDKAPGTAEDGQKTVVPIGRPIANTTIDVLDAELRPVPPGAVGELYIGGSSLARGYLGRPHLTAERFLPDPFPRGDMGDAGAAGRRLYRTGDLGRRLPDGTLEYAGRTDQQLKIHGVRVEPGEIEAVLREHPAVSDAAVIAGTGPAGHDRLVAYVAAKMSADGCPTPGRELEAEVRGHLADRLPGHLVPASITVLADGLPRTPSGKLDRRGLPVARAGTRDAATFSPPSTPLEVELADAFARLLGLPRIGRDDRFFDEGADSLTVAQLGTHVMNTYGISLPLFLLFSVPTVSGVAETVESYRRHGEEEAVTRSTTLVRGEAELDPDLVPDWRNVQS
jgi:amino acid adenylation domain-containing protein